MRVAATTSANRPRKRHIEHQGGVPVTAIVNTMPANEAQHNQDRRLRIAMVAPPWYEVPPTGYGGIEAICATLVDALTARGHEVTLFGAGPRTGTTAARYIATLPQVQHRRLGELLPAAVHVARVNRALAAGAFDVVHDHTVAGPLTACARPMPTVVTVHGPVTGELGDLFAALDPPPHLVAISAAQRALRAGLRWVATVHHGVDPARFTPGYDRNGPVLWLGRFCPDKGPDLAIAACRVAGLPLVLAGKCHEPAERRYLDEFIRPLLHDGVQLICNADRATTGRLLTAARALIVPIRWPEPFGMVMIEAMASATPVVALRRGSVPEIVVDGVTGWICDDPTQLPDALHAVADLDPAACLARVNRHFTAALMARAHERLYRQIIVDSRPTAVRWPLVVPRRSSR
jgi:glycosyltransferase involved in cell wall biosynthesis